MKQMKNTLWEAIPNRPATFDAATERALGQVVGRPKKRSRAAVHLLRVAATAAAAVVVLFVTVMTIPPARAEVLSWFGAAKPESYMTQDPNTRDPNPELDRIIVPVTTKTPTETEKPAATGTFAPTAESDTDAAPRVTDAKVLYASEDAIWQRIAENFSAAPLETLYDGQSVYISLRMTGLSLLPDLDALTGGSATQTACPIDSLDEFFEDSEVPEDYKNGDMTFYTDAKPRYWLVFADGNGLPLGSMDTLAVNSDVAAYRKLLEDTYAQPLSDTDRAAVSDRIIADWTDKELIGIVKADVSPEQLAPYADENGLVTASLEYRVHSLLPADAALLRLRVELGQVQLSLNGYTTLTRRMLTAESGTVVWGGEPVTATYRGTETMDGKERFYALTQTWDFAGLTIEAEEGAYVDALGLHECRLRVTVPHDWDETQRDLLRTMRYWVEIDGTRYVGHRKTLVHEGDTWTYAFTTEAAPIAALQNATRIAIYPMLSYNTCLVADGVRYPIEAGAHMTEPDGKDVHWEFESTDFPEYAISFVPTVQTGR